MRAVDMVLVGIVVFSLLAGCDAPDPPPPQLAKHYDLIELSAIVADPKRFQGIPVRVSGIVQLEFEGNSLYIDRHSHEKRDATKALWLDVGWPPEFGSPELNGRRVIAEGIIDAGAKGHENVFPASLTQIRRLDVEK